MKYFRDKVAVVTGAGSGIGEALAEALARAGARVLAADLRPDPAATLAERLRAEGLEVEAAQVDVTDAPAVQALVDDAVRRWGRLDLMFNNAGVGHAGELRDTRLEDWRRVLDVNLWGVIHGIHAAYPLMLRQGSGQIVNTGSGAGLCPRPAMVPYAASKYAVVGLSQSLRVEAADLGIKVNVVCPGYIATNVTTSTVFRNIDHEALFREIPMKPMTATRCAQLVLRGVRRNRAVIPVTAVTRVEWWLHRVAPWTVSWLHRYRARRFRAHRVAPTAADDQP